jgi:hypothetical protein
MDDKTNTNSPSKLSPSKEPRTEDSDVKRRNPKKLTKEEEIKQMRLKKE